MVKPAGRKPPRTRTQERVVCETEAVETVREMPRGPHKK